MGEYRIIGGKKLKGHIKIGGSKNAVLPILAATVLGKKSIIHNCPKISDTYCTIDILKELGCDVTFEGHTITVDARGIKSYKLSRRHVEKMRSSIIFAGGLLGRFKRFSTHHPGGCKLGARPIDMHIEAFRSLGAKIDDDTDINGTANRLMGTVIPLSSPSVGATQNIMLAAVLAKGKTTIRNAAREPEIIDLQNFLIAAGANISGAGSSEIIIEGVKELSDVEYEIMPDRIVAGTYLAAAAATGGSIRLDNIAYENIMPITKILQRTGAEIYPSYKSVTINAPKYLNGAGYVTTDPHPGFPTDMQPQLTAVLSAAKGDSTIEETIFESRDEHVAELVKMGASIRNVGGRKFHIVGVEHLHGTTVFAKDLRGGAAMILAGLRAEGESIVKNSIYVERGYEAIHHDLQSLGADIKLLDDFEEKVLVVASDM